MTKLPEELCKLRDQMHAKWKSGDISIDEYHYYLLGFDAGAEVMRNYMQAEMDKLVEALEDANDKCRSAYSVASRNGAKTHWEGFQEILGKSLDVQFKALASYKSWRDKK